MLVTRPEPDGERTAAKLRARGCEVMLAPLLRIENIDADLGGEWHAVAVTSVNALRAIADDPALKALLASPAYAVGGRTADAALAQGFENVISADGDVERPRAGDEDASLAPARACSTSPATIAPATSQAILPPPGSTWRRASSIARSRSRRFPSDVARR